MRPKNSSQFVIQHSLARLLSVVCIALVFIGSPVVQAADTPPKIVCAFKNPLLPKGQDPSVVYHDKFYYLVQSDAGGLSIRKAANLTELGGAPKVTIYTPPPGQPFSYDLWAPELVYLNGGWYIYVAADDGPGHNAAHRLYVLQAQSADPQGAWTLKGKIYQDTPTDKWAIDGSVFTYNDQLYMVWSGWPGDTGDFPQALYIAPMSDPLTISGVRHQIAIPDQPWEQSVAAIEEGPEAFIHNGQLSIIYSADASWTVAYKLGMLNLTGSDPLDAKAWTKSGPVFKPYSGKDGEVYGPGHNSMPVPSPDGSEDWLVYHTIATATGSWQDRDVRIQRFTWNADNTPNFNHPIPAAVGQAVPSGQPCGVAGHWTLDDIHNLQITVTGAPPPVAGKIGGALQFDGATDFLETDRRYVDTRGSFTAAAWVQLAKTDSADVIVSQDGGIYSGFALGFDPKEGGHFTFTMADWENKRPVSAHSKASPAVGTWYYVVGVRDVISNTLKLYVNGELQETVTFNEEWDARAHLIIGAGKIRSKRAEFFAGTIDDVQVFNGALSDLEVSALYNGNGS